MHVVRHDTLTHPLGGIPRRYVDENALYQHRNEWGMKSDRHGKLHLNACTREYTMDTHASRNKCMKKRL